MSKGSILIYTSAAGQAAPLPGVTLTVTDAGGSVRARLVTDADGFSEAADLPAPDAAYSLDAANTTVQPYALYRIEAALDGWQPLVLNGVQVFDAQQTVARLERSARAFSHPPGTCPPWGRSVLPWEPVHRPFCRERRQRPCAGGTAARQRTVPHRCAEEDHSTPGQAVGQRPQRNGQLPVLYRQRRVE